MMRRAQEVEPHENRAHEVGQEGHLVEQVQELKKRDPVQITSCAEHINRKNKNTVSVYENC